MSLPILVHLLFVMKKPTTGSVTAPQALPMNSTMEAWKALICGAEQGQTGVKNTCRHKTHINKFIHIPEPHTSSFSLSSSTLPERYQAGRFAGRKPWRWQPPPWARRRWRNTLYCIMSTSGPTRSVQIEEKKT